MSWNAPAADVSPRRLSCRRLLELLRWPPIARARFGIACPGMPPQQMFHRVEDGAVAACLSFFDGEAV
eukprot:8693635-Pyramimonas_sp.AAC.1